MQSLRARMGTRLVGVRPWIRVLCGLDLCLNVSREKQQIQASSRRCGKAEVVMWQQRVLLSARWFGMAEMVRAGLVSKSLARIRASFLARKQLDGQAGAAAAGRVSCVVARVL